MSGELAGQIALSGLIFVLISALIFWPLEELFEPHGSVRPSWKDLGAMWFYQSCGLWISAGLLLELAFLLRSHMPLAWTEPVHRWPFGIQVLAALLLAETWIYVFHRLSHQWDFLWKFHRLHHTLEDMTWSASSRQHPVDFLLIIVGANIPAMLLGIDLRSIGLFLVLERLYTVFLHSNLPLHWGWFARVVASPRLHRHHHQPHGHRSNYAGFLSLLDVIGRTYRHPS